MSISNPLSLISTPVCTPPPLSLHPSLPPLLLPFPTSTSIRICNPLPFILPPLSFSLHTGGWPHGLDVCITGGSSRGDEVTACRPWYRRQPYQRKSVQGGRCEARLPHLIPHSNPRNDDLFLMDVYLYPTSMITWFIVLPIYRPYLGNATHTINLCYDTFYEMPISSNTSN